MQRGTAPCTPGIWQRHRLYFTTRTRVRLTFWIFSVACLRLCETTIPPSLHLEFSATPPARPPTPRCYPRNTSTRWNKSGISLFFPLPAFWAAESEIIDSGDKCRCELLLYCECKCFSLPPALCVRVRVRHPTNMLQWQIIMIVYAECCRLRPGSKKM